MHLLGNRTDLGFSHLAQLTDSTLTDPGVHANNKWQLAVTYRPSYPVSQCVPCNFKVVKEARVCLLAAYLLHSFAQDILVFLLGHFSLLVEGLNSQLHLLHSPLLHVQLLHVLGVRTCVTLRQDGQNWPLDPLVASQHLWDVPFPKNTKGNGLAALLPP